ncbi:MAG: N-acetylglucosamine-6-phosphate deacetylase [Alkalispirochaeta sp.]
MNIRSYNCVTGIEEELVTRNGHLAVVEGSPAANGNDAEYISLPGLVDLQVNGYGGDDYSSPKLTCGDVEAICRNVITAGTLYHLPTIITRPREVILGNLETIETTRRLNPTVASAVRGYHIEGPFIASEEGPRGAHDPAYIRDPDPGEYREWQAASGETIRIVTVAPERRGAIPFIERLAADGVVPAIGHTGASPEEIRRAVAAGARMSTHLGNGSHQTMPRLHNYIWEQLAADELTAGIIADGIHLPDGVLKTFRRAKGLDRLVIVSDLSPIAGLPPGTYTWDRISVDVAADGRIGVTGSPYFAGAWRTLAQAIPVFIRATATTLEETIALMTTRPAELIGLGGWYRELSSRESVTVFSVDRSSGSYRPVLSAVDGVVIHEEKE